MSGFVWRGDDPEWIDELFGRLYERVKTVIYREGFESLSSKEESDDVIQNVLLSFWKYLPNFKYRGDAELLALLTRITRNTIASMYGHWAAECRKVFRETGIQSSFFASERDPETRTPSSIVAENEDLARLEIAKGLLKPKRRQIIFLTDEANKSYEEVATLLGITADAVRMRRNRAVDELARIMAELEGGNLAAATASAKD